ncbi:MAG: hypothetical protein H6563_08845 [Lewinellaceae bacterium]|nr:hypothetical protein [Lewinellaceae bacterium]
MNQHLYRWKTATWVAGLLLLPLWSAGQDYFNFPREHTRVFHLSNGDSIQVRALEIWRQIGHVTVLCNSWTGNSYSPTLYYRTGFSIDPIDRNRLNNDFTAIFDIPAFERTGNDEDPIPSDWLETFEQKLKDHLGETPYVVDFSSPSEFTQHRGIGEVHRFLNGFSNFTPCPSCDGMLYFVFQYQVQYFILYNDPVQSYPKSIEFIQYHPTYHLDCHQLPCDCSWKPECRQACCIPVEGGEICAMLDSTRCISSTVRGRSLTEGTSCNPDPCNEPTADDASKSRIPTDENGLPLPFPKDLICKVKGTGRTTGHVITLTVTNPTADTISWFQTPFIISPTRGEDGELYQGFATQGYAVHEIPPGQTRSIPLDGVCLNLDLRPPTGPVTPVDTWVTPFTAPSLPPPYATLPVGSGFTPITDDGQKNLSLTYPGTDVPFPYTFDMKGDLTEAAGLLFGVVGNIKTSFGNLKTEGQISSPYSGNPELEEMIFTQQPVWIATSLLNGDPYTEEAFQTNLEGQYRDNYGVDISQAPAAVQTEFKEGVTNMWASFTLVGEGAKILTSNPPAETEEEPDFGCGYEQDMTFHPPYCFAMKISENWANEEDRTRIIAATEEALAGSWTNADEVFGQYDISHNPTSATAFWKALNIGGFASGYAKTYFNQSGGSSEWVSQTEQLSVDTSGSSDAWLSLTNDQFCSSFVVGVSLSRLRASSRAFDAMAGNEYG